MKELIQNILTDKAARDVSVMDAQAAANAELGMPWSQEA